MQPQQLRRETREPRSHARLGPRDTWHAREPCRPSGAVQYARHRIFFPPQPPPVAVAPQPRTCRIWLKIGVISVKRGYYQPQYLFHLWQMRSMTTTKTMTMPQSAASDMMDGGAELNTSSPRVTGSIRRRCHSGSCSFPEAALHRNAWDLLGAVVCL